MVDNLFDDRISCNRRRINSFDGRSLVYDVTEPRTLDSLAQWKNDFIEEVGAEDGEDFAFIVVGNKVDLESQRKVNRATGEQVAKELGAVAHFETSAKTAHNVEKAFYTAALTSLKRSVPKLYTVYVFSRIECCERQHCYWIKIDLAK